MGFELIGMIHLLPLPGGPRESPGLTAVRDRALMDAEALISGGITTCIIENMGDAPFAERVEPHVVAMMTAIAGAIRDRFPLKLGINVLRNDARAAVAVAAACGADFVRVNVHTGSVWTDQGLLHGRAHETLRYRRELGAHAGDGHVRIAADVLVKHGTPAGCADIEQVGREAAERGGADVLIVTGSSTGEPADLDQLRALRAASETPVWVGSGVVPRTLPAIRGIADGAIVGTYLHRDGQIIHPLDPERVRQVVSSL